jgi:competence protein ComEC
LKSFNQGPGHAWKESPFIRLLIPMISGILVQQKANCTASFIGLLLAVSFVAIIIFGSLKVSFKFKYGWVNGILINAFILSCGMLRVNQTTIKSSHDITSIKDSSLLWIVIDEPLSEKLSSYKTVALIKKVDGAESVSVGEKILVYLKKENTTSKLTYGDQLLFKSNLKPVKGMGNPAAFDYGKYCNLQGIRQQVYLTSSNFIQIPRKETNLLKSWLYSSQQKIVSILQKYVPATESGMAEALLIGYKEDLDKSLVQSYSNTGVVHIIAISGLHLGLIYALLAGICTILRVRKPILKAGIIITGLWTFSLLAGAGPSILRSAVMFTFIVAGKNLKREIPIFNSLAASAFALLCYNPMWLWDVGFQLSYAAVTSLVLFYKPVYGCLYFPNKLLDNLWKLNAVTIAAQLLTLPLTLFYFHQFPNMFLFTNLATVPLSSGILLMEILLCTISFIQPLATISGLLVFWMIRLMNFFVIYFEKFPGALWENLQLDIYQVVLMYIGICCAIIWLKHRSKPGLYFLLLSAMGFVCIRSWSFYNASMQQKLIVYNIPSHHAIDFIKGRRFYFDGDDGIENDLSLINFHIKPSRIWQRVAGNETSEILISDEDGILFFGGKRILLVDTSLRGHFTKSKPTLDIVILSANAKVSIADIMSQFSVKLLVFDSSNNNFSIKKWQQQCEELAIPFYSVPDKGAFVMNLN